MPREPATVRAWMKAADIDLSRAIRIEAADSHGVVQCVTCPYAGFWSDGKMSGGHWIGKRQSIRYVEMGINPQCSTCNCTGVAHQVAYARDKIETVTHAYERYMRRRYGERAMDALRRLKETSKTWTADELRMMRHWYKWRLKVAKEEKGL